MGRKKTPHIIISGKEHKSCKMCCITKPVTLFYKKGGGRKDYHHMCKSCVKIYYKDRWANASEEEKEKRRDRYRKWFSGLKNGVFDHYGRVCACCGEDSLEFLTVDHIQGGGRKHRKELGDKSYSIYKWLKENNYPDTFRILCMNCNFSFGQFGYCPHNKKEE